MPSRKRAKGKARKAKARESNCNLILHNDNVCRHGCDIISKDDICYKFVEQLEMEMKTLMDLSEGSNSLSFTTDILKRLKASKEYDMIWNDNSEETQQKLQSLFINLGTNLLLRDEKDRSIVLANAVVGFEAIAQMNFGMAAAVAMVVVSCHHRYDVTKALTVLKSRTALRDLNDGLQYDIIKFFHKRTSCRCLEKLYLEERAKSRQAACWHCKVRKERSQLYLCSACSYFHYCSKHCQAADWPDNHQRKCKMLSSHRLLSTCKLTVR